MSRPRLKLLDPALLAPAAGQAFAKLDPRVQWRNPVMFVVYVGSVFTAALAAAQPGVFTVGVALWLAYGWRLGAWPIIIANAVTLLLALTILTTKLVIERRMRR